MTTAYVRKHLIKMKHLLTNCSLGAARAGQGATGLLLSLPHRSKERCERILFPSFSCGLVIPEKSEAAAHADPEGAILYLHGGGFVAGGLEYARGYASVLAEATGLKVFFPAYRLAPEHRCPTALKDCLTTYRYLTDGLGIPPEKLILCGESAGGGLLYSLCCKLRAMGRPMPSGLIAISPWTDLTMSGASYEANEERDPSMTRERLQYFAACYTDHPEDPMASPLFADLHGLPPSLIFSGGDEIMLSDAVSLHEKLLASGCRSTHRVTEGLWHAYLLYCLEDHDDDNDVIREFIKERLCYEEKFTVDEA